MKSQKLIEGVKTRKLSSLVDERGFLMEIFRSDWGLLEGFRQVYVTACKPGYAKAWHCHTKQRDAFAVLSGNARIVLFDNRKESSTCGMVNEFDVGESNPLLIVVPSGIFHGFMALGNAEAHLLNVTTGLYNYRKPDELRLPLDSAKIPYSWGAKKGW